MVAATNNIFRHLIKHYQVKFTCYWNIQDRMIRNDDQIVKSDWSLEIMLKRYRQSEYFIILNI